MSQININRWRFRRAKEVEFPPEIRNAIADYPRLEASDELKARLNESVTVHLRREEYWKRNKPRQWFGPLTLRQAFVSVAIGIFGAALILFALSHQGQEQIRHAQNETIMMQQKKQPGNGQVAETIPFRFRLPWK